MTFKELFDNKIIWFEPALSYDKVYSFMDKVSIFGQMTFSKKDFIYLRGAISSLLKNFETDIRIDNVQKVYYFRFYHINELPYITVYGGEINDYDVALSVYKEFINEGYKVLSEVDFDDYDEMAKIFDKLNESKDGITPKVGDYLYCFKDLVMDDGEVAEVAGNFYEIFSVNRYSLKIMSDDNTEHNFDIRPSDNDTYQQWFSLIPREDKKYFESIDTEDIFSQLD